MRVAVVGAGAVGARAARQLCMPGGADEVLVVDIDEPAAARVVEAIGKPARQTSWDDARASDPDVVVLAMGGPHAELAAAALAAGAHVVSATDAVDDVRDLLALDAVVRSAERNLVVGAGFAPGLTDVLAAHAAARLDEVHEVHVAKVGTGGPACAELHHASLAADAFDWLDGEWVAQRGGSGRELVWFPDPIGGVDCYRGGLADGLLLVPAFDGVRKVTARVGASRRDRLTARLPMLRRPHPEAGPGAVRVEVRGRRGQATAVEVLGSLDRPGVAAGAVAAVAALWASGGRLSRTGAGGLAELAEPLPFLTELARRGVKAAAYAGA